MKAKFKYTKEFIKENADYIDWDKVSYYFDFLSAPIEFIRDYESNLNWQTIAGEHKINWEFFCAFKHNFKNDLIKLYMNRWNLSNFPIEFFEENPNCVDWDNFTNIFEIDEEFLFKIKNEINWNAFIRKQKVSENFIRNNQDFFEPYWDTISSNGKLSEKFMRDFQHKINWNEISMYQKLSENFMREFQDKLSWYYIFYNQNMSKEFMLEFYENFYNDLNKIRQLK